MISLFSLQRPISSLDGSTAITYITFVLQKLSNVAGKGNGNITSYLVYNRKDSVPQTHSLPQAVSMKDLFA